MIVAVGFLVAALYGASALRLLRIRLSHWEFIALAPGIGAGLITLATFVALAWGVPFALTSALIAILALPLILWWLRLAQQLEKVAHQPNAEAPTNSLGNLARPPRFQVDALLVRRRFQDDLFQMPMALTGLDIPLVVLILLLVGYAFLLALYWPPYAWDALAIWVVKAKAIFATGSLAGSVYGAYPFYPLHIPLQMSLLLNRLPISAIQIIFPIYFALLLLSFGGTLRRFCSRSYSLVFVLLLAATPTLVYQSTVAMADVPFTYYYVSSVLYLFLYLSGQGKGFALLSGMLVGIAAWTRPEGLLYFAINLAVLAVHLLRHRRGFADTILYLLMFGVFWLPWTFYSNLQDWQSGLVGPAVAAIKEIATLKVQWDKVGAVLAYFESQWTNLRESGAAWILFGVSLLNLRAMRQNIYLLAVILLNVVGLLFTYYAVPTDGLSLDWWLRTGFIRMATHFMPLLLFYAAILLQPVLTYFPRVVLSHEAIRYSP